MEQNVKNIYAKQQDNRLNLAAQVLSTIIMWIVKIFAMTFYKIRYKYLNTDDKYLDNPWEDIKIIIFLNHTSLYEPLFIGILPFSFIANISKKLLVPVASKTYKRPIVGTFFRFLIPNPVPITRKRDKTWEYYMRAIQDDSIICIAPEGRMKRANGLDLEGKPMSVKGGVAEILQRLNHGNILFAYSGGLHHVQKPGQRIPRLFQTIRMNIEIVSVQDYKKKFEGADSALRSIRDDIQDRLNQNCP